MTWLLRSKLTGQSDLVGVYTVPVAVRVLAQSSSASTTYSADCFSALPFTQGTGFGGVGTNIGTNRPYTGITDLFLIQAAYLTTVTAVTGTGAAGAGATANILLFGTGGTSLGTLFTLQFNTSTNTVAGVALSLGSITGISGRNYGSAVGIRSTESIRFQWVQGTTGLALPEALVTLDIV